MTEAGAVESLDHITLQGHMSRVGMDHHKYARDCQHMLGTFMIGSNCTCMTTDTQASLFLCYAFMNGRVPYEHRGPWMMQP